MPLIVKEKDGRVARWRVGEFDPETETFTPTDITGATIAVRLTNRKVKTAPVINLVGSVDDGPTGAWTHTYEDVPPGTYNLQATFTIMGVEATSPTSGSETLVVDPRND